MKRIILPSLFVLALYGQASAQVFTPSGSFANLAAGASSARVALPTNTGTISIENQGPNGACVLLGNSSVVATSAAGLCTASNFIQPFDKVGFSVGANTYIAAINQSSGNTTNLVISGGVGFVNGVAGNNSAAAITASQGTPTVTTGTIGTATFIAGVTGGASNGTMEIPQVTTSGQLIIDTLASGNLYTALTNGTYTNTSTTWGSFVGFGVNDQTSGNATGLTGQAVASHEALNVAVVSGGGSGASLFAPGGTYAALAAGTTSARVALPAGTTVTVENQGPNAACVLLGNTSVVATSSGGLCTNDNIIPPFDIVGFTVGANVDIAAINQIASNTTNLVISGGSGFPSGVSSDNAAAAITASQGTPTVTTGAIGTATFMAGVNGTGSNGTMEIPKVDANGALYIGNVNANGQTTAANASPVVLSPDATPARAVGTATTGASTATIAAVSAKTNYLCHWRVSAIGGTATIGPITITGLLGGTMTIQQASTASGINVGDDFGSHCLAGSAVNTAIVITTTADGTATAVDVEIAGYTL